MTERDERALRAALGQLDPDRPVDVMDVRSRAAERRRNRRTVAALAVVLVLVGGVVGLPRVLGGSGSQTAGTSAQGGAAEDQADQRAESGSEEAAPPSSVDPAPDGWRTEYYRDISFQVPAAWGYAEPPNEAWCAQKRTQATGPQNRPYVWLDTNRPVLDVDCEPMPPSLLAEHVEAFEPGPAIEYVEGARRQGGWWVVTRFAGSGMLRVTTKDRQRAERILDSAGVVDEDAPCTPASPVAGPVGTRPPDAVPLDEVSSVDTVVVCQYEPVRDAVDVALPRLRAARRLAGDEATQLVDRLRSAPAAEPGCTVPDRDVLGPDVAIAIRIGSNLGRHDLYVSAVGCGTGDGTVGGIDDGVTVRDLTRQACRTVVQPPIALFTGSGDLGTDCIG